MKNQEITAGDSVTFTYPNGSKITQPITKEGLLTQRGYRKSPGEVVAMLSSTCWDKGADKFTVNAESVEEKEVEQDTVFTKKERYNAKKDYRDFQKENPNAFRNSLKQFRAMVNDKFANTKIRVRMNVTVIA